MVKHSSTPNLVEYSGQINWKCIECGYDLSGHHGALRRCPECGYVNHQQAMSHLISDPDVSVFSGPIIPSLVFLPVVLFGLPLLLHTYSALVPQWISQLWLTSLLVWLLVLIFSFWRYRKKADFVLVILESHWLAAAVYFIIPLTPWGIWLALGGGIVFMIVVMIGSMAFVLGAIKCHNDLFKRLRCWKRAESGKDNHQE
ncbi:MAG: hypothetical protein HJJLKODD_00246 [Phycisphaerae bacterium]|nr:hypothetical protein [Phycisphaerae bacterium]